MSGTILQLSGLALLFVAGLMLSVPAAFGAAGIVALYVGLAIDRGGR